MDIIFIKQLKVETTIGVYSWEKKLIRPVMLDLELATDAAVAAKNDDLTKTPDYSTISSRLIEHLKSYQCELLETLAEYIVQWLHQEFGIKWLSVCITKTGALPIAQGVGIKIERSFS